MWDKRYAVDHYIYGLEPNDFLAERADALPKGDVLCLAEGEGRNAVFLARRGYRVTAVDSSSVALAKAEKLAAQNGVGIECIHADLNEFDIGASRWEGIVSIFCHLPPPLRQTVYRGAVAGLKPGGVLLLEAYTPDQLRRGTGGPPVADLMMSEDILREDLAGLHFAHLQEIERQVVEGTLHTGLAAVVQAVAVKL